MEDSIQSCIAKIACHFRCEKLLLEDVSMNSELVEIQLTPYQLLRNYFRVSYLREIYEEKFQYSESKGIDRINGNQFKKQSKFNIKVIHEKCLRGAYKFSPYLELLKSKGRNKNPRVLAIPTVRDRIVLHALKEILFQIFPECVPTKLANTYVHEIKEFSQKIQPSMIGILHTDIENFYGSINREILLCKLASRIKSKKLLRLIRRAIETPVVPKDYRKEELKSYEEKGGIPQGLAISNILAAIYLLELDREMQSSEYVYFRYVDDILIFATVENVQNAKKVLDFRIAELELNLNLAKTDIKTGDTEFDYLGYRFKLPNVTVKPKSVENFLLSITAMFSRYIHTKKGRLRKYKYLTEESLKEEFLLDVNEKITGAISENRRYGWIFYFNEINTLETLHQMDKVIESLFSRLEDFGKVAPSQLKRLSRAYYEARYSPTDGYVHNYNEYEQLTQKIDFLSRRGRLDPEKEYSEVEIVEMFESIKRRNLAELDKDSTHLY